MHTEGRAYRDHTAMAMSLMHGRPVINDDTGLRQFLFMDIEDIISGRIEQLKPRETYYVDVDYETTELIDGYSHDYSSASYPVEAKDEDEALQIAQPKIDAATESGRLQALCVMVLTEEEHKFIRSIQRI